MNAASDSRDSTRLYLRQPDNAFHLHGFRPQMLQKSGSIQVHGLGTQLRKPFLDRRCQRTLRHLVCQGGLASDFDASWTLTQLVGAAKARELLLLGDPFDATEAQRIGLVTRVVDAADLLDAAHAMALR